MATIEELEQRAADVAVAEAAAISDLVGLMRDRAVVLPEGSRLAMRFALVARSLDRFTTPRESSNAGAGLTLFNLMHEIEADEDEQRGEVGD